MTIHCVYYMVVRNYQITKYATTNNNDLFFEYVSVLINLKLK